GQSTSNITAAAPLCSAWLIKSRPSLLRPFTAINKVPAVTLRLSSVSSLITIGGADKSKAAANSVKVKDIFSLLRQQAGIVHLERHRGEYLRAARRHSSLQQIPAPLHHRHNIYRLGAHSLSPPWPDGGY